MQFMSTDALSAERLYILGDLFEYWIGDDAADMVGAKPLLSAMKLVSAQVDCYFIAGNRDFLVRDSFSQATGFEILPDETVVNLYGTPTLLLHGDSLCTDDIKHQQFRTNMMTNTAFCDQFLSLPIPQRVETAKQARMESGEHKSEISMEIMDVTLNAVEQAFVDHQVAQMIHGHTHRQASHDHNGKTRYVLGDWDKTSSIMKVSENSIEINNAAI